MGKKRKKEVRTWMLGWMKGLHVICRNRQCLSRGRHLCSSFLSPRQRRPGGEGGTRGNKGKGGTGGRGEVQKGGRGGKVIFEDSRFSGGRANKCTVISVSACKERAKWS